MRKLFLVLLTLVTAAVSATVTLYAQDDNGADNGITGFWECETDGGNFVVRLDKFTCLSRHQYLIDGTVRVYECTVDSSGGVTARFYYLEPVSDRVTNSNTYKRLKDISNKASGRAGTDSVEAVVTKHYPDTTHAKTSEYRLQSREAIDRIYRHAYKVWAEEKGRGKSNKITIRE